MKRYTKEFKKAVVNFYFSGAGGYKATANHFGIVKSQVCRWVDIAKFQGLDALETRKKCQSHSIEFKHKVVLAVQQGLSLRQAAIQFNLTSAGRISTWLRLYEQSGINALLPKQRRDFPQMKKSFLKKPDSEKTQQELVEELLYLRAEVDYLKKLKALVQKEEAQRIKRKSSKS